jgi:hypothetical protein
LSSWAACWPACRAVRPPGGPARGEVLDLRRDLLLGSLAGSSEDSSQPAPKATSPAASGFPVVRRRIVSGVERTVSTADEAAEAAVSATDEAAEAAVSRAAEARALTLSPALEVAP